MTPLLVSLLFISLKTVVDGSDWDYDHMTDWPEEFHMCGSDDESPIDIRTSSTIIDSSVCTEEFEWDIDYTKQTFKITNNGHSVALKPVEKKAGEYTVLTSNQDTIATFPNYFRPEGSDHDAFCLDSLHFHWGSSSDTGSEHFINGKQYPLEVHFVHFSCSNSNLSVTLNQFPNETTITDGIDRGDDIYQLGVVSLLFDLDDDGNPVFDDMFPEETVEHIRYPHTDDVEDDAEVVSVDLEQLIPDTLSKRGYYAYQGSLTTPPCTDIVRWFVMRAQPKISEDQLELFRELMRNTPPEEDTSIAPNFRELQDNTNNVYKCIEEGYVPEAPSKSASDESESDDSNDSNSDDSEDDADSDKSDSDDSEDDSESDKSDANDPDDSEYGASNDSNDSDSDSNSADSAEMNGEIGQNAGDLKSEPITEHSVQQISAKVWMGLLAVLAFVLCLMAGCFVCHHKERKKRKGEIVCSDDYDDEEEEEEEEEENRMDTENVIMVTEYELL